MKSGPSKLRIALVLSRFSVTGISTVVLNYAGQLDRSRFDLTILAGNPVDGQNRAACARAGIRLVELPSRHKTPAAHYWQLFWALRFGGYDLVHVHGSSSMMAIDLTLAKLAGISGRIAHSHNSACTNPWLQRLLNPYFRTLYTRALACGRLAGEWLFGSGGFDVLPNAFALETFRVHPAQRARIRHRYHLENRLVVGHIGRFNAQKNHPFLLQIFARVASQRPDAVLLLAGDGPDREQISRQIRCHPARDRIMDLGQTDRPADLYAAMDVFVLPSRYEGLPMVLLEAQYSGLPCVASDTVTREMDFGRIQWLSLSQDPAQWAQAILDAEVWDATRRAAFPDSRADCFSAYDITRAVKRLESIYLQTALAAASRNPGTETAADAQTGEHHAHLRRPAPAGDGGLAPGTGRPAPQPAAKPALYHHFQQLLGGNDL